MGEWGSRLVSNRLCVSFILIPKDRLALLERPIHLGPMRVVYLVFIIISANVNVARIPHIISKRNPYMISKRSKPTFSPCTNERSAEKGPFAAIAVTVTGSLIG